MRKRITIEVDEVAFPWLTGFIATMEHALKCQFNVSIRDIDEAGHEVGARPDRSTVRYHAIAGREALTALGDKTIIGLIFAHLCEKGARTAKEIQVEKPFNMKTIVASIYRLREMGLVEGQKIDGIEQTSGGWGT